jgi:hypothetical protein
MEKQLEHRIGGTALHVSDFCIRKAIHYLDSPTNYREYLPQRVPLINNQMRMLDDEEHVSWSAWLFLVMIAVVIGVIVAAFVGWLT